LLLLATLLRWLFAANWIYVGQSATSPGHASMSERSPEADIELSCVNVAENAVLLHRTSLLWNDGLPAP
jgi:hypothetical protein